MLIYVYCMALELLRLHGFDTASSHTIDFNAEVNHVVLIEDPIL